MGLDTKASCPRCDTELDVELVDEDGLKDAVLKATSEEVIVEAVCKNDGCDRVWRIVYSFAGNE